MRQGTGPRSLDHDSALSVVGVDVTADHLALFQRLCQRSILALSWAGRQCALHPLQSLNCCALWHK